MAKKTKATKSISNEAQEFADDVNRFFFGNDAVMSQKELLNRNVDFMRRCGSNELRKGESIRIGSWADKLPAAKLKAIFKLIITYDAWSNETDPRGTRGNGVVLFEGNYVLWAIREVDLTPPGMLMATPPREVCLLIKHSSEI